MNRVRHGKDGLEECGGFRQWDAVIVTHLEATEEDPRLKGVVDEARLGRTAIAYGRIGGFFKPEESLKRDEPLAVVMYGKYEHVEAVLGVHLLTEIVPLSEDKAAELIPDVKRP